MHISADLPTCACGVTETETETNANTHCSRPLPIWYVFFSV